MSNYAYFKRITVNSTDFALAEINWVFDSEGIFLAITSSDADDGVEYSFDSGGSVHGDLIPGETCESVIFDRRTEQRVNFRCINSGKSVVVRVEVWAKKGWK